MSKSTPVVAIFDFRLLNLYLHMSRLTRESGPAFFCGLYDLATSIK